MSDKPVSAVARVVHERVKESVRALGGLEDNHLKFLTYFLQHEMKVSAWRLQMDYNSKPKVLTIHVFGADGAEVYIRPKQADILDKMVKYLKLPEWQIKFATKGDV